jgi:hypothetical protein
MPAGLNAHGFQIAGGIATRGQKDFSTHYPRFDEELEAFQSDVPALTDEEIVLRLMRLVARAGAAHNRVNIPIGMGFLTTLFSLSTGLRTDWQ